MRWILYSLFFASLAAARPPNVIIIMVDDMGYAGPSCAPYNNPHYPTPGMDRLAEEGLRFTDFHSSGTMCSPTRAGLLTGRYQQRAGIEAVIHPKGDHPEHHKGLQRSETTFAELFKAADYATGLVGKWHLGYPEENPDYHPDNHGFDWFRGYHSGNIDYVNHWGDHLEHDWWHGRKETVEEGYTTHLINRYALEFINQHKHRPFCLYIAHEAPHSPIQGPGDPPQRGPGAQQNPTPVNLAYQRMILAMDEGVAQVRNRILELGLGDHTLIWFFSDNGDAPKTRTGSPRFRGHKGQVYEGGTRVPSIAWWPGTIKPGVSRDDLAITLDVMPTILSLAGIDVPDELDGRSLAPVLTRGKSLPERSLFWASLSNGGRRSEAMREGAWKLVVQHPKATPGTLENPQFELFHLGRDEKESTNLAASEPARLEAMRQRLETWYAEVQDDATVQPGGWVPKAQAATAFFNRRDLTGWTGNEGYWSVKDGAIVGHANKPVPKNEFLWSEEWVHDFYLSMDVKLDPANRNAGIQFRSRKANAQGQAVGYQADVGAGVWGKLYHEHGRGKLDWNNRAGRLVKPGEWNHYEILAVGDRIWTAINGGICVAYRDPTPDRSGYIALQIHSGPPQTVQYRNPALTHNPPIRIAGKTEQALDALLAKTKKPLVKPAPAAAAKAAPDWPARIAAIDPGSQQLAWAQAGFSHEHWKKMNLPVHFEQAGLPGYDGVVWFRKHFDVPATLARKTGLLSLGPIDDMDVTWLNGQRIGGMETPGHHYTPRDYPVPKGLVRAGRNTIAVRVMDHGWPGGIAGNAEQMKLTIGTTVIPLHGTWRYHAGADLATLNRAPVRAPVPAVPGYEDGFSLDDGDVVAFIGGTSMVKQMASGELESRLQLASRGRQVRFLDLSWQADTVFERQRPRNFQAQGMSLDRIGATQVVAQFGQMEALQGADALPAFLAAYERLLGEVARHTRKIVLVTPYPFSPPPDRFLPDLTRHNPAVQAYAKAIRELAAKHGWLCVDLSGMNTEGLTTDGLQLNDQGHAAMAEQWFHQLTGSSPLPAEKIDRIKPLVQAKHALWHRFWRPTNWAFLHGNRSHVPSSHDHRPGKPRWFPEEVAAFVPLIEQAEQRIRAGR